MNINESKNRRMKILQQIAQQDRSRSKERMPSAQRRKKIQSNLNDFMKTMSNISFKNTKQFQSFQNQGSDFNAPNNQSNLQIQKNQLKQQYDEALKCPSFKDLQTFEQNKFNIPVNDASVKFSDFANLDKKESEEQNDIEEQEIKFDFSQRKGKQIENSLPKPIEQNQSSASAIFFTSQFNQFISKNHLQSSEDLENFQKFQQKAEKQKDYHHLEVGNSPDAILVKNQQRQILTKQKFSQPVDTLLKSPLKNVVDPIEWNNINLSHFPQTLEESQKQNLIKNKSGHSLALSNESSLKYSLYESNIKDVLNRKLNTELIADANQFEASRQNQSLYHNLKLQLMSQKLLIKSQRYLLNIFLKLSRTIKFIQKIRNRQKRTCFEGFILNQEINLQEKKNEIICTQYLKQKLQIRFSYLFNLIKMTYFTIPRQKLHKAANFRENKEKQFTQKIFRCLKIVWFNQKVKKQVDLFYLSKLFSHFVRIIRQQKINHRNQSLTFYSHSLKKKFFAHLKEGVQNLQNLKMLRDNATCHYHFTLIRKVFDAWNDKLSYKSRYISLAMTTKNTFKQTADQKWLQIKTVDFKQIK